MKQSALVPFLTLLFLTVNSTTNLAQNAWSQSQRDSLNQIIPKVSKEVVKDIMAAQEPYTRFFNTIEGINSTFEFQLNLLIGVMTLISLFFLAVQFRLGFQESKRMNEINEAYKVSIERTTSFISSYEQLITLKDTAAAIDAQQRNEKERLTRIRLNKQMEINAKAIRLVSEVFKANYTSTFLADDTIRKYRSFFIEASAVISLYESDIDAEQYWNGDVFFLMALDQYLEKQPVDTKKYIDKAIDKVTGFITALPTENLLSVLFPSTENEHYQLYEGGILGWNTKLFSVCLFYQGLHHYRRGEYTESTKSFNDVLEKYPFETDAIFLKFQSKFWNKDFDTLEKLNAEMENVVVKALLNDKGQEQLDSYSKDAIKARLYMKLGDFSMHQGHQKDVETAINYYEKAFKILEDLGSKLPVSYGHIAPMLYFGFAKAIVNAVQQKIGTDMSDEKAKAMYTLAERSCISIVLRIENRETRYILYYILSECQMALSLNANEAAHNNQKALESFREYCSHTSFYGYSPISNEMLPKARVEDEIIEHGRRILQTRT